MENKGLNIFDAKGICADPDISTDQDYLVIERILAHEVFHNWTGNRVTCRDWFQLSLKEGLTRFRDQCFSQDMSGAGRKRIEFVRALQRNQFPEDDGPAAHPVRPDHYIEIRNFYTGTVYDKGAEVIRMMHCLLGDELFRDAVKHYLKRHGGQAVTVEDFFAAVEAVSGRNLSQFCNWYHHAGRPVVTATGDYDPRQRRYTLVLKQRTGKTAATDDAARPTAAPADATQPARLTGGKPPFHIPVLLGLISGDGDELEAQSDDASRVDGNWLLELTGAEQRFVFRDVASAPVPSLLRGFSAPVSLQAGLDKAELALLWTADNDSFNRWQSGQALATRCIREQAERWHAGVALDVDPVLVDAWSQLLQDGATEPGLLAELLALPDEPALSDGLPHIDLDGHRAARDFLLSELASRNRQALLDRYQSLADTGPYSFDAASIGRRALRNGCLELLLANPDPEVLHLAQAQATAGPNMTEMFAALAALCHIDCEERRQALQAFYARWEHKPPVIDKWFNAQALSRMPGALDAILELEQHPALDFDNVPRAMAFYGGFFRQNRVAFHSPDGRGYDMLADRLILLDSVKPGATYWLMPQILQWQRVDPARREKMRAALEKIRAADISDALLETVSKALEEE
jgi:aminopeptidase N